MRYTQDMVDVIEQSEFVVKPVEKLKDMDNSLKESPPAADFTSVIPLIEKSTDREDEVALDNVRAQLEQAIDDPKETRMKAEQEIVKADPEHVGMVIDHEFIVNPWNLDPERRIKIGKELYGIDDQDIAEMRNDPRTISEVAEDQIVERAKVGKLKEYLSSFDGKLEHVRIHPPGEVSPLSLGAAVSYVDGERRISLSPEYIEEVRLIQEHAEDVTLVVSFFDSRNGLENTSPIPTGQSREDYIALCKHVVDTFGSGVSLEFGVEPNVSHDTGAMFEKSLQYLPSAGEVDPQKYGEFYAEVAAAIKEGSPDVACLPAGTAFFDRGFTEGMLTAVMQYEDSHNLARGSLIDALSFHPYRDDEASEACDEIVDGKFVGVIHGSYRDQLDAFREICAGYDPQIPIRHGEFNFQNSDPNWEPKLKESVGIAKEADVLTYIYPGFKPWN